MTPREVWQPGTTHLARRVLVFDQLDSTNRLGLELAFAEGSIGLAVLADEQTAGRGQHGRQWLAGRGSSVLLSVLLHDLPPAVRPAMLTAWAAVAVCDVVRDVTREVARIKWPNDVHLRGRKVCGILIEQCSQGPRRAAVVGIGLNVRQSSAELAAQGLTEAISLAEVSGAIETRRVAHLLIRTLDEQFGQIASGDWEPIERQWTQGLALVGKVVTAVSEAGNCTGRLTRLGFTALELRTSAGPVHLVPEEVRSLREAD